MYVVFRSGQAPKLTPDPKSPGMNTASPQSFNHTLFKGRTSFNISQKLGEKGCKGAMAQM